MLSQVGIKANKHNCLNFEDYLNILHSLFILCIATMSKRWKVMLVTLVLYIACVARHLCQHYFYHAQQIGHAYYGIIR